MVTECLCETNINFCHSSMVILILAALKKVSKKKETKKEKYMIEVFKHASEPRKKTRAEEFEE